MRKRNNKIFFGIFAILIVSFISLASAFGISSPHWNDNPLKIAPGESTTISLGLQNMVGGEDVLLQASVSSEDGIIVELGDESSEYFVPFGTSDRGVSINVKIPKTAKIGDAYKITLSLKSISKEEGGTIKFTTGVTSTIPVEIVGKKDTTKSIIAARNAPASSNFAIYLAVALIAVALAVFFVAVKFGKKNKKADKNKF